MDTDIDKIDEYLAHLSEAVRNQFKLYYDTVLQFNLKLDLVPKSTLRTSGNQQFTDCVLGLEMIQRHIPFSDQPIFDFGSGNGFPGLILAITRPELTIHLVERDLRKAEFLNYLISQLQLKNARVLTQSMESLPKSSVSCGIVRGVGSIANLTIHLTSVYQTGGHLFHFKGDSWASEIASCPTQMFTKWTIQPLGEYRLPANDSPRSVVSAIKIE